MAGGVAVPPLNIFTAAIFVGGIVGVCFDFFRILRIGISSSKKMVLVQDVIFGCLVTGLLFFFYLGQNKGEVRFIYLFGVVLGWVIYYFSIGVLVMSASKIILLWIGKILCIISKPFVVIWKYIYKVCTWVYGKVKIKKNGFLPLQLTPKIMYNYLGDVLKKNVKKQ